MREVRMAMHRRVLVGDRAAAVITGICPGAPSAQNSWTRIGQDLRIMAIEDSPIQLNGTLGSEFSLLFFRHCDTFCQISWLVDIVASEQSKMVRKKL